MLLGFFIGNMLAYLSLRYYRNLRACWLPRAAGWFQRRCAHARYTCACPKDRVLVSRAAVSGRRCWTSGGRLPLRHHRCRHVC